MLPDLVNFIGSLRSVLCHDDGIFKFTADLARWHSLVLSFFDQLEAVIHREELRNVVHHEVQASLEDPTAGEKSRPGLNRINSLRSRR